jgi:hypothetical protein
MDMKPSPVSRLSFATLFLLASFWQSKALAQGFEGVLPNTPANLAHGVVGCFQGGGAITCPGGGLGKAMGNNMGGMVGGALVGVGVSLAISALATYAAQQQQLQQQQQQVIKQQQEQEAAQRADQLRQQEEAMFEQNKAELLNSLQGPDSIGGGRVVARGSYTATELPPPTTTGPEASPTAPGVGQPEASGGVGITQGQNALTIGGQGSGSSGVQGTISQPNLNGSDEAMSASARAPFDTAGSQPSVQFNPSGMSGTGGTVQGPAGTPFFGIGGGSVGVSAGVGSGASAVQTAVSTAGSVVPLLKTLPPPGSAGDYSFYASGPKPPSKLELTLRQYEELRRKARDKTARWLGDELKEKVENEFLKRLPAPLADLYEMAKRHWDLFTDLRDNATGYLENWYSLTQQSIACLGSTETGCGQYLETQLDELHTELASKTQDAAVKGIKEGIKAHAPAVDSGPEHEDPRYIYDKNP